MNCCDPFGRTPLMWALLDEKAPQKKAKLLLEAGADAKKVDKEGRRAIDYAKENTVLYILGDTDDTLQLLERASLD